MGGIDAAHVRLNLGCGQTQPPGWINVDGSWNARIARYGALKGLLRTLGVIGAKQTDNSWANVRYADITRRLPFEDQSADVVFSSHALEHLYRDDAVRLLGEAYRVLRPGGVLRVIVPDLSENIRVYTDAVAAGKTDDQRGFCAADRLMEQLLMREQGSPRTGNLLYRIYTAMTDFHSHKWMYDEESLLALVRGAGFVDAARRGYRESRIADLAGVEIEERVLNGQGIVVEAVRP